MDILKVPTEIFLQITEMISEEDVKALGQVSRGFRCQCEPLLYRSVTLSDRKKYSRRISTHILYRLKNVNDSMVHNVRHLSVGYESNASAVPERLLLQALQNMRKLESFSWYTWIPVPAAILECLRKVHPSSHLKAIVHERNGLPFDIPLITSPQLHTLDIKLDILYPKIIPKASKTGHRKCKGRSELNYLKCLIMEATNLKVFKIKFGEIKQGAKGVPSQLDHFGPAEYDPISLKFAKLDMITTLEEFTLRIQFKNKIDRTTAWRAWPNHQSWTSLRKLDLGITASEDMIQGLVGAVPRMTTLVVKVDGAFPSLETLRVYESFFQSVPELSSLSMRGTGGWHKAMLETIYRTVSAQLIYLHMDIGWDLSMWRRAQFKRLLGHSVRLERLILEGLNRLERTEAKWTADEAKLPLKERLEHLRQYSADRPRKMEYQHAFAKPHGQRSRGSHSLVRRWSIVSTRPYWLDRDEDSDR